MSINKLFDISRRSLLSYQAAINATSNNISNANNPDYSRQRVILTSETPDTNASITMGSGVKIGDIQRIRDSIIDTQVWKYNSRQSLADKQASSMSKLEALLSEPTDLGISNLTSEFFNSWDKLSVDPSSTALRNNVVNTAQNLSTKVQSVFEGYNEIRTDIKDESIQMVNSINSFIGQIHTLNKEIYSATASGGSANDLMDKRNALINDLSKIADVNVTANNDNSVSISIGGVFSVDRLYTTEFKIEENASGLRVVTTDGQAKMSINSGELAGNLNVYNKTIPDMQTKLDGMAQAIYDNVNALHSTGFTNESTPQTGINFFSSYTNGQLVINQNIVDDTNLIAASGNGQDGDNDIATQLANLEKSSIINGETISSNYSNFVNSLANEIQLQNQNKDSYQLVLNQLDTQIAENSGVSVDEEMVNIIRFQRSYDAAARLIRVADEMFETMLNAF